LFRAFVEMGARLSSLTQSLAPPLAALTATLLIPQHHMSLLSWIGMSVTLVGIMWVITEREIDNEPAGKIARRATPKGLALGLIGAAGQGVGLVLSDIGMQSFRNQAFASNQIRSIGGIVGFGALVLVTGDLVRVKRTIRDRHAMIMLTMGAITGPFLGVSMLLKSMSMGVQPGVAQTFASLVPVMIIPFLVVMGKEHVTWRAVVGAIIAVAGVAILLNA
jgi:drug/metabolite transporter (DMT)-like permease